ncbi:uncharacterized protein LOC123540546 isoform X2 [Mercenaria mercenaria]|uniref:uncharacterized protein LOC123540546 isoform X2 n=1 Tax=Mercenaria mercenaria TaxID=6596 RepID=UPI00234F23A2|nr:uncharacterized protein LOC123540546 isoform X2 [Mercenaria mercenaria]
MDEAGRKVLKSKKGFILKNLILNDEILDFLENKNVLTEAMIQTIKAERTDNDKIVMLLYILTRRGPTAFQKFVEAIRPDFSFVSEMLEAEYATELSEEDANSGSGSEMSSQEISRHNSNESINKEETEIINLCKNCSHQIEADKQPFPKEKSTSGTSDFMQRMMQEFFTCWYTKLKSHMTNRNLRELSFKSPVPITYDMVDQLIDELIGTVEGCYEALGKRDNLKTHVIHLKESRKKMKQELKEKEDQRNKYADNIIKLENRCRDLSEEIEAMKRNNQKVHAEMMSLEEAMEVKLKEKDTEIDNLGKQLTDALKRQEEDNQKLAEAKTHIRQLQGAGYGSKRSRSRDDYLDRGHVSNYTQRNKKHNMHTESTALTSRQVKEVQHINDKETEEFTAVEEPDGLKLRRTESFVETWYQTSLSPVEKAYGEQSQRADKENNNDFVGKKSLSTKNKETSDNSKPQQQSLMISNSSNKSTQNSEPTDLTKSKRSHSRKNSINRRPRRKIAGGNQQTWFGTYANNQQTAPRNLRHASNESPRILDTLVINCVNNNQST